LLDKCKNVARATFKNGHFGAIFKKSLFENFWHYFFPIFDPNEASKTN